MILDENRLYKTWIMEKVYAVSSPATPYRVVAPQKVRAKLIILPAGEKPDAAPVQLEIPRKEPNKKARQGFWESFIRGLGTAGKHKGGE